MREVDALDVYLHGDFAGVLERRSQAKLRFTYGDPWVIGGRPPLSLSLPVRSEPFDHDECSPFFEGLLPEGEFLKAIARTLHVSANNPFQLLTELGGECAGAISVAPEGGPEPGRDPRPPRWLNEEELGALLAELPRRPLIAAIDEVEDGGGFRLSLAGAQDKVGVLVRGDEIGLSHGRPPTTGILKAPIPHVSESVVNEAFCMSLAARVELETAAVRPRMAASREYLLVHRYDRGGEAPDKRIHQEDFCQALGLVPAVKYEKEGGPSVADCAELIRRHVSAPARDITAFLDALLFNFVIANHDAHSKNYSLLLDGPGSIRLAPLYDLISTAVFQGSDRKLAMRYGGENRPAYLRARHLDRLAGELGVKPALVRRRAVVMQERTEAALDEVRRSLPREFQDRPLIEKVVEIVKERGATLAQRATEVSVPVEGVSVESAEKESANFSQVAEAVSAGFVNFGEDLDRAAGLIEGATADLKAYSDAGANAELAAGAERLAIELAEPARGLREHGRLVYDAMVEFDSEVERRLAAIADEGDSEAAGEFLTRIAGLAENIEAGIEGFQKLYTAISDSGLAQLATSLRDPMRNMRAGLHDFIDAQEIITEWGRRAAALR